MTNRAPRNKHRHKPDVIQADSINRSFKKIIGHVSRQQYDLCWHCWACGGGCPFSDYMDLLLTKSSDWSSWA